MPTVAEIAELLNCAPPADAGRAEIIGIASIEEAGPEQISYVASDQYVPLLAASRASVIIAQKRLRIPAEWESRAMRVDDPEHAVAQVLAMFAPPVPRPPCGIDSSARVSTSATLESDVAVGPHAVIGDNARLGRGSVIHAGVFVGADVSIGEGCEMFPNVVIRERITIGNRVIIHAGSVLGTDGFGYRWDGRQHQKVPQIGTVIIEDDVEIGSCVCIDRAKFGSTRVGRGTKIDNLVQVGHNVQIGPHCILVGQAALAGSVRLGSGVVLGGQAAVRDHVVIGDGAMAAGCSGVAENVDPKTMVSGTPALPHRQSLREQAALRRLPDLVVQVRKLQEEVDELRKKNPAT
jgi:UDP-3-O-[3-hydroxymyristoyl] glucosamine N-acyltransferase